MKRLRVKVRKVSAPTPKPTPASRPAPVPSARPKPQANLVGKAAQAGWQGQAQRLFARLLYGGGGK